MAEDAERSLSPSEFFSELVGVTRSRPATTHLYLSLEADGRIWVQWEQPGVDHPRRYRVRGPTGPACPHCTIIEGVERLAPVLPLDVLRTTRARHQYEAVLATRRMPSMAMGRQAWHPDVTWLVDCHAAVGDPHTDADCDTHRDPNRDTARSPTAGEPLATVHPVPGPLAQRYPSIAAAEHDIGVRLAAARDWRAAAEEVARGHAAAQAPWAFLRERCLLGVDVLAGAVYSLRPGRPPDRRSMREAIIVVAERLRESGNTDRYQDDACLVPVSTDRRLPSYAGAVDLATGEPTRTLLLPTAGRPLSRLGRGVLLLFEARHAMHIHMVSDPSSAPGYWQAEAALHIFEFDLLARYDGYRQAVEVFGHRLAREGDLLDRPQKVLNRRQRQRLAETFGHIDDEELHLWASVAYRNAIFAMLGRDVGAFAAHLRRQAGG